ncbi:unnamed protein product [Hydatigera taeniaeformis]|uniref:B box-type domain-containing protein n=1 Tax=Hydatigena taeniaeformis TaxID=6205 RepID=A0A0R3X5J8_HYDTA|nr:unnamed protein product [Hydatigera taeniaeformis]
MASSGVGFVCGVCLKPPCLLSHTNAVTARCIHCHATFDVSELRPNYCSGVELSSQQKQGQQVIFNVIHAEEVSLDARSASGIHFPARCSTCRKPAEANELAICHHCHHDICQQCREKHRDSFSLVVRVKLNALSRHKLLLKSRLESLCERTSSALESEGELKGGIFAALEEAVMELRVAASKSLDTATAKLEVVDVTGYEMMEPVVRQITDLFSEVNKVQAVYASLGQITSLKKLITKKDSLQKLFDKAAPLEEMMEKSLPLPITQMRLSDRFSKASFRSHLRVWNHDLDSSLNVS